MKNIIEFPFENTDKLPLYSRWTLTVFTNYFQGKLSESESVIELDYNNSLSTFTGFVNPYEYVALMEAGVTLTIINVNEASTMEGSWYGLWKIQIDHYALLTYQENFNQ